MITLEKAREIVDQGDALIGDLHYYDRAIAEFERQPDMVQCIAFARAKGTGSDFGRFGATGHVELLPIPKTVAISALQRERSKIVSKLAELGVTVEDNPPA